MSMLLLIVLHVLIGLSHLMMMHLFPVFSSAVLLCMHIVFIHVQISIQQHAGLVAINLSVFFL